MMQFKVKNKRLMNNLNKLKFNKSTNNKCNRMMKIMGKLYQRVAVQMKDSKSKMNFKKKIMLFQNQNLQSRRKNNNIKRLCKLFKKAQNNLMQSRNRKLQSIMKFLNHQNHIRNNNIITLGKLFKLAKNNLIQFMRRKKQ